MECLILGQETMGRVLGIIKALHLAGRLSRLLDIVGQEIQCQVIWVVIHIETTTP